MKTSLYKLMLPVAVLSASLTGCKKTLDINQNPNQVPESAIKAELIIPSALLETSRQAVANYGWLANWMGYWSPSGSYNPNTEESTYNITSSFVENKWPAIYNVLFDLHNAEKKAAGAKQTYIQAMAMVMSAYLYQNLVDLYGNVPYSEAFQFIEHPTPKYDKGEDVYAALHKKLDDAVALLKAASPTTIDGKVDIVYHGEAESWIRLANTLKLRLLLRTSEITPNPTAELAKITANGGVLGSEESASANPGFANDNNKQSPFFGLYGLTPSGNQANEYFRANAYIIQKMKDGADPRIGYFFKPAANPTNPADRYVGTVYGRDPNTLFNGDRTSNIGTGLARKFDQPQWIITSVEAQFFYAEAVARGWFADNVKDAYENAVYESFLWLGTSDPEGDAIDYLATPGANWANAGATVESKVNFIVKQKYMALVGINPLEAWSDYRRLGIPTDVPLSVNPARGSRVIPARLIYPAAEYAVNGANVAAQGNITPNSKIFWDK
ncbi:SusD/RagB family nutrient-binding outer membrane lipoprotein [Pseudoflavitalea sp. G-6-1-2]|uniref:SusD/RagB family nutrient-binding outer membrane lipoprotein n=1 Tax=Pseudoflavitalea sp. G-6-1-2 TaxID=2728841 RepID=UPI00146D9795|nr:SusD/RagB family nutrient-binding outer membrane lipoprotein [Pseudoflavitalea sp. G-6-1-2]NML22704.1 SusD/RagB family nutrient-binding outer membrane lipoprotein [Pseudoflavitalea sp. G-6-1-2]